MAGDFSAILSIIGSIVLFVLKRTIDLICLTIYLISFILPWRIIEEINHPLDHNWKSSAFLSFCVTLFDCFAIPLGIISLFSPLRWPHILLAFRDYKKDSIL